MNLRRPELPFSALSATFELIEEVLTGVAENRPAHHGRLWEQEDLTYFLVSTVDWRYAIITRPPCRPGRWGARPLLGPPVEGEATA